ncbi:hypothetical protein [Mesoflavibacter sp. CH_XMU1404-2]|uniref:hypothetical protein n=1 Tax=Mesoflavibacter sp. CH_XMU1404-2 TaxID=3107766 RepID=UPI00243C7E93
MKLNKKKIIAREFLTLIACALVFGLAFICTIPYNYVIESRIEKLETTSQSLSDSINKIQIHFSPKIDKQKEFFEISESNRWHTKQWTYKELWSRLQKLNEKDSLKFKWNNEWSSGLKKKMGDLLGFKKLSDFEDYIENNSLTPKEVEKNASAEKLIDERENIESKIRTEKYKLLDFDDRLEFSLICLIIIGVLSFPLRYLFYAIKWSIKTLKQNEQ